MQLLQVFRSNPGGEILSSVASGPACYPVSNGPWDHVERVKVVHQRPADALEAFYAAFEELHGRLDRSTVAPSAYLLQRTCRSGRILSH